MRRVQHLDELATLLEAGVDWQRASGAAGLPPGRAEPLRALEAAGWIRPEERPLLESLKTAGRLDRALRLLADRLHREENTERRIRAGLLLPALLWVVALVAAPLPALFRGELDGSGYLFAVLQPLVVTGLLVWAAFRFWRPLLRAWRRWRLRPGRLPGAGRRQALLRDLGAVLGAGVPADQALEGLAAAESGEFRRRLNTAAKACAEGLPVVEALRREAMLEPEREPGLLSSGEAAGRLPAVLQYRARELDGHLALRREIVAEWLPRGVYLLVLVYTGYWLVV
ncbi:type II secretion system F family protein [Thioalkalivibrio sp. ALJ24]|uniref:type II secretion system F family protein n=1 Tax=Thioalkalivibrio sp. ALJ24 TaxID=545276 RepID=UPI000477BB8E|nr:type II secretion system F family protein [Thioalkalivibrio sp. ALJ24]